MIHKKTMIRKYKKIIIKIIFHNKMIKRKKIFKIEHQQDKKE